jgi:cold shock CspA family protein
MAQGTVKRFGSDKGYGFIAPGGGARDVSVHPSTIEVDGYRIPRCTSASRRRFLTAGDGAERD